MSQNFIKAITLSKLTSHFSNCRFANWRQDNTSTHARTHFKSASSAIRQRKTFSAEHQSNPSLSPRQAFILLFVTKMINSHLAYYCTACCRSSCNYTILSFSAVSDPCRGRGYCRFTWQRSRSRG